MPDQARPDLHDGLSRREVLKRAAIVGGVAWAAPVVQSLAGTPAFALGTPAPCFHSTGGPDGGGCKSACAQSGCTGGSCGNDPHGQNPQHQGPCNCYCPSGQGGGNPCCNNGLCDPTNYICHNEGTPQTEWAEYTGSLAGCPAYPACV